ncbi:MAG: stress response translation initiation inhibitor YciH [Candidatus Diapherotrites archaeon]|uniref:Protein translation factor SUI1 homolog n=1 Tax=Candidatus Iainarchaeum sp. TaxID=3101447 RepID=A0A8T5GFZ0_9ARCH|nr:stress response translation initiation inhibitor YciH [Candidatus Diapherotrites archaeon]MBT7241604.1 stress response translation initiation inhibitor YciH [Candidatus Diapherotrites archaeon]
MQEIDKISGLPKDLFDISDITKEQQKIKIDVTKRRFSKLVTVISGIDDKTTLKEIGKEMKQKFACGGTVKDNEIELQGNHRDRAKELLIKRGYKEELIDA